MCMFPLRLTVLDIEFFKKNAFSLLLALFALFASRELNAQEVSSSVWIQQGRQLWTDGYYDSAFTHFQQAQQLARKAADTSLWAEATFLIGKHLNRSMNLSEAEAKFDSIIALHGQLGEFFPFVILARKELADMEVYKGNIPAAIESYEKLVEDFEPMPAEKDSLRALCYQGMGVAYIYYDDFDQALHYFKKGLEIRKRIYPPDHLYIGFTENAIGSVYSWYNDAEASLVHFLRAQEILSKHLRPNHPQLLQIQTNIGIVYSDLGLFWKSLEYHKANVPYLKDLPPLVHLGCIFNLGSILMVVGDYDEALSYFDEGQRILEQHPEMSQEHYAYIDRERSRIYMERGDYESAHMYLANAYRIDKKIFGEDHSRLINDFNQSGILLSEMGKYAKAIANFEDALALAEAKLPPHDPLRGRALEFLGETLTRKGESQRAIEVLRQANEVYNVGSSKWNKSDVYMKMADAWLLGDNWDSTIYVLEKAWKNVMPEVAFHMPPNPNITAHWSRYQLAELLKSIGQSFRARYGKSQQTDDLNIALGAYEVALMVADSQRHYYESPLSRQQKLSEELADYEATLQVVWELFQITNDEAYLQKAFLLAEKSKAANLRDHLRGRKALHFAGVPDELVEKEQYYRQRLAAINEAQYKTETDSAQRVQLEKDYFDVNQAYQAFLLELEKDFPSYYQLKYSTASVSFEKIVAQLDEQTALFSYFWGEMDVFVFRLFRKQLTMHRISLKSDLISNLNLWLAFISQPPVLDEAESLKRAQAAYHLTNQLLPELSDEVKKLLIIPDGKLGYLPFESLLLEKSEQADFRSWAYLGKMRPMIYVYAAELWVQKQDDSQSKGLVSYQGFAPDFESKLLAETRANLGRLRFNQQEVSSAAQLLDGKAFLGVEAREEAVKMLEKSTAILHFATHALADGEDELNSRLYFQQDSTSTEDGVLHAYEIYGLSLKSPLTVLSACQTGIGPLKRGEGIMSLARAFQYAGSERVITSLWRTDDQSVAQLTTDFFEALSNGKSSESALKLARTNWIEQADSYHAHPYFWAGFVLIGDGGKIGVSQMNMLFLYFVVIGGMIMMLVIVYRIFRPNT